jgi:hypothetical protein
MRSPAALVGAGLVLLAPAAPAQSPPPPQTEKYVFGGRFLKVTPLGGFLMIVKRGNEAGMRFAEHKVVFKIDGSRFRVADVNGDGAMDENDFARFDRVRVIKRGPVGVAPRGNDPQKLGKATIASVEHPVGGQPPPQTPPAR